MITLWQIFLPVDVARLLRCPLFFCAQDRIKNDKKFSMGSIMTNVFRRDDKVFDYYVGSLSLHLSGCVCVQDGRNSSRHTRRPASVAPRAFERSFQELGRIWTNIQESICGRSKGQPEGAWDGFSNPLQYFLKKYYEEHGRELLFGFRLRTASLTSKQTCPFPPCVLSRSWKVWQVRDFQTFSKTKVDLPPLI